MSVELITFGFCFVLGPLLCAVLLRLPHKIWVLGLLGLIVIATATFALRAQQVPDANAFRTLVALWLAWVLAVALVALAVRSRLAQAPARRGLTIFALLATTLPWFGLATAQWMA